MPATFSSQSRIDAWLRNLNCTGTSLFNIAKSLGVDISQTTFSRGMRNGFDTKPAAQIIDVCQRMHELQKEASQIVLVPIAWDKTDQVVFALTARRLKLFAQEINQDDHSFDAVSADATQAVTHA